MILFKKRVLDQLDQIFGQHGLERISDKFYGHRYDRPFPGGRRSIAINWHIRKSALVIDPPYVSVTIDEVEQIVGRYEEEHILRTPTDVAQRPTIGCRLDGGELMKTFIGKWVVSTEDDCARVAASYASETLRKSEIFWRTVPTPESILVRLSGDPVEVRTYALPDHVAAERAIVLSKLLHGCDASHALARERLSRLSGNSKEELSAWLSRASPWFEA